MRRRRQFGKVSGHCIKCGTWRESLHRDHIVPLALGGADVPENIQLLCANCHQDKTAEERKHFHWKWSTESREKLSRAKKGRIVSLETRKKLSDINTGKSVPEEVRKRISATLTGRKLTPQHRQNIALANSISAKMLAYRSRGSAEQVN